MTFNWDPDDIDEATNLPRIPEGYFWRVHDDSLGLSQVSLYRRRKAWFPAQEGWYLLAHAGNLIREHNATTGESVFDPEDPKDRVYIAARSVIIDIQDYEYRMRKNREVSELFGDYPPKKL